VAAAYQSMAGTRVVSAYYHLIWKIKAPCKASIFFWLLLQDRLLTQQRLQHRGLVVPYKCYLCDNAVLESGERLFSQCHVASSFWQHIRSNFNMPPTSLGNTVQETWFNLRDSTAEPKKSIWDAICVASIWNLWK
jgi:zinc-binding in reverse transcriptase